MTKYRNVYGRRGGRGLRLWLLMPKLVAVLMLIGGLAAVAVLLRPGQSLAGEALAVRIDAVATLFRWLAIPGVTAAVLLGIALIATGQTRVLLRLRWVQVKLTILLIALPSLHVRMSHHMESLHEHVAGTADRTARLAAPPPEAMILGETPERSTQMDWLFSEALAGIALMLLVVGLSRLKPRLGQNRTHLSPSSRPVSEASASKQAK